MQIALVSLHQVWEDKKNNLIVCEKSMKDVASQGVSLIIFPEMTLTGFSMNITTIAEDIHSSFTIKSFQKLAKKYNIAVVFGVVIQENKKASNRVYFVDNKGEILEYYQKIHPFSFVGEDQYYSAGTELKSVVFEGVRFGFSICYDLRFSNLYAALMKQETDCIINIANWPAKRVDHWKTLLKARAIETQQYIIGVNRVGSDANGLEYEESSLCFNANGEEVASLYNQNNIKIVSCDTKFTQEFREHFNTIQDFKIIKEDRYV